MKRNLSVRILAAAAVFLAGASARAELADGVPGDAVVYIGWEGADSLKGAYQDSHLKAVMDACTLPEFLQNKVPTLLQQAAGPNGEDAERIIGTIGVVWRHPTVVYVGKMDIKPGRPPIPRIAVVCDAGGEAAAIEMKIQELIEKAGPAPLHVRREGKIVMLEIGDVGTKAEAVLLHRDLGPDKTKWELPPLSADKAYQAAIKQVQIKNPAFTVYANVPIGLKMADDFANMIPDAKEKWPAVRDALNLQSVRAVCAVSGFDGKDWVTQAFVGMDGPRTGLLSLLDGTPLSDDQLKLIPESATSFWAARFDAAKLWEEIAAAVAKADFDAGKEMDAAIKEADAIAGIDIQKDLVVPLGDTWINYSAPDVGGTGLLSMVVINPLRDGDKLAKTLATLEDKANENMDRNPVFWGPKFAIRKTTLDGVEVHHIALAIFNPSWAVHEGKLYLSLMPQTIPAAVAAGKGKIANPAGANRSILDNPAYIAFRKRLGVEKPLTLNFVDLPKTAPDGYGWLSMIATMAETFAGDNAPPSLVPPLHKILPELTPSGSATWSDKDGWHFKDVRPMPGTMLLSSQELLMWYMPSSLGFLAGEAFTARRAMAVPAPAMPDDPVEVPAP